MSSDHFFEELTVVKKLIVRMVLVFLCVFFGLLVFGVRDIHIGGWLAPFLSFDSPTLATRAFVFTQKTLLPEGVPVVALGPVSSFIAPIVMAFLVTVLLVFPILLLLLFRYLRPALREKERKLLNRFFLPSIFLFYLGCAAGFFIIIPQTFSLLYSFSDPIGVAPFFALDDFLSSVLFLTVSVGFAFLLPVGMAALSRSGIVPPEFWKRHIRGAILSIVIFSALITPDGSGVTMAFLVVPLFGLYVAGIGASGRRSKP